MGVTDPQNRRSPVGPKTLENHRSKGDLWVHCAPWLGEVAQSTKPPINKTCFICVVVDPQSSDNPAGHTPRANKIVGRPMNEGIPEFAMERPVSDCPSKAKSERAAQTISSNLSSTAATRERLPGVIDAWMLPDAKTSQLQTQAFISSGNVSPGII